MNDQLGFELALKGLLNGLKESLNERFTAECNHLRFSRKVTVLREKMFSCEDMKSECIRRMAHPNKYLAERDLSWMLVLKWTSLWTR